MVQTLDWETELFIIQMGSWLSFIVQVAIGNEGDEEIKLIKVWIWTGATVSE